MHIYPGIYLATENFSYETVDEVCATSHRPKLSPLPPNEVDKIAQHVRKGEGRIEGKDGVDLLAISLLNDSFHVQFMSFLDRNTDRVAITAV